MTASRDARSPCTTLAPARPAQGTCSACCTLFLTHERIALELGSAREVISRLLKEFERLGAVKLGRGCVSLRDEKRLRDLGCERGTGPEAAVLQSLKRFGEPMRHGA